MKTEKCQYYSSERVMLWGEKTYCGGCFEAGARSTPLLWEKIQKHIEDEVRNAK